MKELILIYSGFIALVVLAMLAMLLYADEKREPGKRGLSSVDKWIVAGGMIVAIMIVHLNVLTLPGRMNDISFITGLSIFGLFVILSVGYTCWFLFFNKEEHAELKIKKLAKSDGGSTTWHIYVRQKNVLSKVDHSSKGKVMKQS